MIDTNEEILYNKVTHMTNNENTIAVTHVNIRQSISFLLLKLVLIDILAAIAFLLFFPLLLANLSLGAKSLTFFSYGLYFFIIVIFKIPLSLFVVLSWLFEYYEIWRNRVVHKKGIFWTKREDHEFKDLKYLKFEQGILGKLLNFGTIIIFDWKNEVEATLYFIHNPKKHYDLLKRLVPTIEREEKTFFEHSEGRYE